MQLPCTRLMLSFLQKTKCVHVKGVHMTYLAKVERLRVEFKYTAHGRKIMVAVYKSNTEPVIQESDFQTALVVHWWSLSPRLLVLVRYGLIC